MNDLSQDAWFYTQNGAKGGPVGFSALQQMAREGKLNPRQDLIWSKGMESWQAAGEVQGVFERRVVVDVPAVAAVPAAVPVAVPEVPTTRTVEAAAPADPYISPEDEYPYERDAEEEAMPGARRRSYLFFLIVFPILWSALVAGAGVALNGKVGQETLAMIVAGLLVLPALLVFLFSLMRLVNVGMSRWWIFGNLVPILNLWVGYRCFACPAGFAIHKKMDGVGIFLAIIYWLLIVAGLAAFGALVAIVLFDVGSEQLRDQIVDPIKQNLYRPAKP